MIDRFLFNQRGISPLLIIALSVLTSLWLILIDPTTNNDGILYLIGAEAFLEDGLLATLDIYHWPFLQILIATLHSISGLSLTQSALTLTTLCYLLLTFAFCRTVAEMGGNRTALLLAVVIVIFTATLNGDRSSIVREPGMLAFMLLALVELIRYAKTGACRHALLWTAYIAMAFLFRVEALGVALLSPFGLLLVDGTPLGQRFKRLASLLPLPCGLLLLTVTAIKAVTVDTLTGLKPVVDLGIFCNEIQHVASRIAQLSDNLAASGLLRHTSVDDAAWGVAAVMLTIFALNLVRAITLPYLAILAYSRWTKMALHTCPVSNRLIKVHLAIILVYLLLFIFIYQFSLERYSLQISVLLMLYLPFILARWWHSPRQPLARILIVVLLSGYAIDTVVNSKYKKGYMKDVVSWLQDATFDTGTKVLSNDPHIAYYSGRVDRVDVLLSRQNELFKAAYEHLTPGVIYAYRAHRGAELEALQRDVQNQKGEILKEFHGGDGRNVLIFRVQTGRDT